MADDNGNLYCDMERKLGELFPGNKKHGLGDFVNREVCGQCGARLGPGYSLDRVDVNGNYCRENVRWATRKEQARNKRNTKTVEWRGEKRPLLEWAEITGIPYPVLQLRLDRRKWTPQQAFTTPVTSPGWQKGMKRGSRIGG